MPAFFADLSPFERQTKPIEVTTILTARGIPAQPRGMNTRMMIRTLAFCLVATAIARAENAEVGTWKLNKEKSNLEKGMVTHTTVVIAPAGTKQDGETKITTDGVDRSGRPVPQRVWVGKKDGTFYPVKTSRAYDAVAYTKVDAHTSTFAARKGDKVVMTGTITTAYTGKSRLVTTTGQYASGKPFKSVEVYDRQ